MREREREFYFAPALPLINNELHNFIVPYFSSQFMLLHAASRKKNSTPYKNISNIFMKQLPHLYHHFDHDHYYFINHKLIESAESSLDTTNIYIYIFFYSILFQPH